ncbi:chemotaxis protein CheB [Maridesulfovibrio frigidus]|uniref:chemotaxis protein CheB n=1 Tax=Maridesulfovibrio frigidus TaxID=340956 RepID=UPI000A05BBEC
MFHSLVEDRQVNADGVVFAGMGSDGMFGLGYIKEKGGLTFFQVSEFFECLQVNGQNSLQLCCIFSVDSNIFRRKITSPHGCF